MNRCLRWVGAAVMVLGLGAPAARAQFGYVYPGGYGGWGGWGGGTVTGNNAAGMGMFATGVGRYNVDTAAAQSVNLDTAIRYNQALWATQRERNYKYYTRQVKNRENLEQARNEIYRRLRDDPRPEDIESGDALNLALDQINDPNAHASGMSGTQAQIPSELIKDIPFNRASEAITVSLNDLTDPKNWPEVLKRPEFENERAALADAAAQARREDDEGDIKPETYQRIQDSVQALRNKVKDLYPENSRERREALPHLKALAGLVRMLGYPETRELLRNVDEAPTRSLADLINFMNSFNLRFGVAETPRERAIYQQLYPLLDQLRDQVTESTRNAPAVAEAPAAPAARGSRASNVRDFFGGMPDESLESRPVPSVPTFRPDPTPPQPVNTQGTPPPAPKP